MFVAGRVFWFDSTVDAVWVLSGPDTNWLLIWSIQVHVGLPFSVGVGGRGWLKCKPNCLLNPAAVACISFGFFLWLFLVWGSLPACTDVFCTSACIWILSDSFELTLWSSWWSSFNAEHHSSSVKLVLSSHLVQTPGMCLAYNHRSKIQYGGGPDRPLCLSHTSKIQEALTDHFDQTWAWLKAHIKNTICWSPWQTTLIRHVFGLQPHIKNKTQWRPWETALIRHVFVLQPHFKNPIRWRPWQTTLIRHIWLTATH